MIHGKRSKYQHEQRSLEESDHNPHGWLNGSKDFSGGRSEDVVETARELESKEESEAMW